MCLSDPSSDPRPRRAIELCKSLGYDSYVLCYPPNKSFSGVTIYTLTVPSKSIFKKILRRFYSIMSNLTLFEKGKLFWEKLRFGLSGVEEAFQEECFDLLIVEDIQLLPLAISYKGSSKVLFDAREYFPRQNESEIWFELFEKNRLVQVCRKYLPQCDAIVTVSEGLRREYLKEFGLTTEVFRSIPSYVVSAAHPTNPDEIRMVYHGVANRNRRIENLIEVVSLLDERFSLALILTGNSQYQRELQNFAVSMKRVSFIAPVPFEEIIPTIGQYDIGFFYCEPTTFNLLNCLPNKFFEFIQARLMIAIGPSPEMTEIVKEYGCGIVARDFSVQSMASALNSLSAAEIDKSKQQSDKAARDLCFENECEKFISILERLLNNNTECKE